MKKIAALCVLLLAALALQAALSLAGRTDGKIQSGPGADPGRSGPRGRADQGLDLFQGQRLGRSGHHSSAWPSTCADR